MRIASQLPVVSIIGRPNVGKSTLFNRILRKRISVIDDTPGVTRDRVEAEADWNGVRFTIVDTGGFVPSSKDAMLGSIAEQVKIALAESQVVIFLVDIMTGITDLDLEVVRLLQNSHLPVVVFANKADNLYRDWESAQFHKFGLGEPFAISAMSGKGLGDALDQVVALIGDIGDQPEEEENFIKLAIIGRPNVGKSTLMNVLLGEQRVIVSPEPGTTRDAISASIESNQKTFMLIDTAGLRKPTKVKDDIEFYSNLRSQDSIKECDIALLVIDLTVGFDRMDVRIAHQVIEAGKGLIIIGNKVDLIPHKATEKHLLEDIQYKIKIIPFVPILFLSAATKKNINKLLDLAAVVFENGRKRIPTAVLNKTISAELDQTPPPTVDGKAVKVYYISQLPGAPPAFALFVNRRRGIPEHYRKFVANLMRAHFGFEGNPVRIFWRSKDKKK